MILTLNEIIYLKVIEKKHIKDSIFQTMLIEKQNSNNVYIWILPLGYLNSLLFISGQIAFIKLIRFDLRHRLVTALFGDKFLKYSEKRNPSMFNWSS